MKTRLSLLMLLVVLLVGLVLPPSVAASDAACTSALALEVQSLARLGASSPFDKDYSYRLRGVLLHQSITFGFAGVDTFTSVHYRGRLVASVYNGEFAYCQSGKWIDKLGGA